MFFYGNCQASALMCMFRAGTPSTDFQFAVELCHAPEMSKERFTRSIQEADVIVTQPISDGYGGNDYSNTAYVLEHARHKKVIIFNSCYLDFYYPDLCYQSGTIANAPVPYHYQRMIDHYKAGKPPEAYISDVVENETLISKEDLLEKGRRSIDALRKRDEDMRAKYGAGDNVVFVRIADFVERNYRDRLLFYSMNHPTKHLFQFICDQITDILKVESLDTDRSLDPLSSDTRCTLYKCVQSAVNFRLDDCSIKTMDAQDPLAVARLYYDAYDEVGFRG